ncbi:FkbM family methyltransferase [Limnospira platensis]|uniref:FkbM family methyltransferase n=1 Tax=Limnospira platensis TaxID=118562 RepID=UPI0002803DF9|nr:tetratricopeptide TPR_2 [Arthrospira platensis C1]UWU51558.1 methyltransferase, FkbM family [Arthrospira platensis C1]
MNNNKSINSSHLLKQANQFKREQKFNDAIKLYHQVIDINPHFAWAYHGLGDALAKQGNLDEAVAAYSESIKINPNSACLLYSLGDTLAQLGDWEAAVKYLQKAVDLKPSYDRLHQRLSQAVSQKERLFGDQYISLLNDTDNGNWRIKDSKNNSRKSALFIDCGGYDGCSAIKFLMSHLNYDCVSFEPNPDLWDYYTDIPTKLIKKAVFTYDGIIEFTVDPVDADGSSLLTDKKIDFHGKVSNENCPVITVDCIDLSAFISQVSQIYPKIILKLDVEGAEYDILEKMVQERTVRHIDKLYCEFHWHKVNIPKERHDKLITKLEEFIEIDNWDGQDMSVHNKEVSHHKIRYNILKSININRRTLYGL